MTTQETRSIFITQFQFSVEIYFYEEDLIFFLEDDSFNIFNSIELAKKKNKLLL